MNRLTDAEILEIAKARQAIANQIDEDAANEGDAIRTVRYRFGVVGHAPGKKRSATSGCSRDNRKFHGRLSLQPVADVIQVPHTPPVIIGGRTKEGKPFKASLVVSGWKTKPAKG